MRKSLLKAVITTIVISTSLLLGSFSIFAGTVKIDASNYTNLDNSSVSIATMSSITEKTNNQTIDDESFTKYLMKGSGTNIDNATLKAGYHQLKSGSVTTASSDSTNYRLLLKITPKKSGTLKAYIGIGKSKSAIISTASIENESTVYTEKAYFVNETSATVYTTISLAVTTDTDYYIGGVGTDMYIYGLKFDYNDYTSDTVTDFPNTATVPTGDQYTFDASNSYIIHTVTAAEMKYNELALANSTNEVVNSTKTVYSTITFPDGSSITAPEGTYLYAVKVDKTTEPTNVNYSWIEKTN